MSTRRWKLATLVFAAATTLLALRGSERVAPVNARHTGPATPAIALRRLHAPAAAAGINEASLIAELRGERDARRVVLICQKLAFIGSDLAADALADFADDRRTGVATAALMAIGQIGTESAVTFLVGFEQHGVARFRSDAVRALGKTLRDEARVRLIEIANQRDDVERVTAIAALEPFDHPDAVAALAGVVTTADYWTARAAIRTLGEMTAAGARPALILLMRSSDARVVASAIDSIEDLGRDAASREQLYELLETGDATIAAAAATALGRAGVADALPALELVARTGAGGARVAAVDAISEIGGADAISLLGKLLVAGDKVSARAAAEALIASGEDEGRALLLAAATKTGPARMIALQALRDTRGPEVETLMLDIARSGTSNERRIAYQALVDAGSSRGFDLVVAAARSGIDGSWPVSLIAMGPSDAARSALGDLARTGSGPVRIAALEALGELGLDAPARTMLVDLLAHGDNDAKRSAATTLARSGSPEARDALRSAVGGPDRAVAEAAMRVMLEADGSPAARDAIVTAARGSGVLREHAIDALLDHGAPQGVALAREAIASGDETLARNAANALGRAADSTATDALLAGAASTQPGARRAAAGALAERGDQRSRDALAKLVNDGDAEVRHEAFNGLAEVGNEDAVATLSKVAAAGSDDDRRAAISALGNVDGEAGHDALARVLTSEREPTLVLAAIRESRSGGAILNDALQTVLHDPGAAREVQTAAAERLDAVGALADTDRHYLESDDVIE